MKTLMDIQNIFFPSGNSALLASSTSILLLPRELCKIVGGGGVVLVCTNTGSITFKVNDFARQQSLRFQQLFVNSIK